MGRAAFCAGPCAGRAHCGLADGVCSRGDGGGSMSKVDIAYLRDWIGKERSDSDTLSVRDAHLMAATLGLPATCLEAGSALPPLWHWLFFLEGLPPSELGRDGHP